MFLLKQPQSFYSLYQPVDTPYFPGTDEAMGALQEDLDYATQTLVNLCISLNERPLIRYHTPSHGPLGPLAAHAQDDTVDGPEGTMPHAAPSSRGRKKQSSTPAGAIEAGQFFTQQLAFRVQAALDDYMSNGQLLGDPMRPQGVLFITDRSMDLSAPFLHEFTYQAMIHDLLEIENGTTVKHSFVNADGVREDHDMELTDEDDIWVAIRHLHIAEAIEQLTRQFQQHVGEASSFQQGTSISDMRDMLASLPHMQTAKERLSLHLTLAQQCMDRFSKSRLPQQAMVEQNSATGQTPEGSRPRTLVEEMVLLLDDPRVTSSDKVRIIALYVMFCDGVQDEDRRRLFQHARLSHSEMGAVNNLRLLGAQVVREPSGSGLDAIFRKRRKHLNPRSTGTSEYELSRYQPLIRTMIEDHTMGRLDQSLFPYVKDAPPDQGLAAAMSARSMGTALSTASGMASTLVSHAINATGGKDSPLARVGRGMDASSSSSSSRAGGTTSLRSAKPTWHQKSRANSVVSTPGSGGAGAGGVGAGGVSPGPSTPVGELSNPTTQRMIVFIAGGMTYSEMRTAYETGKRQGIDVYIGSSHVFTPNSFIQAMQVLGTPRQPPSHAGRVQPMSAPPPPSTSEKLGLKKEQPHKPPPMFYPQYLQPQERYNLRYETDPEPEQTESSKEPRKPKPFSSLLNKGDANKGDAKEAQPQKATPPPPTPPAQDGATSKRSGRDIGKDFGKIKVRFPAHAAPLTSSMHSTGRSSTGSLYSALFSQHTRLGGSTRHAPVLATMSLAPSARSSAKERHYAYLASRMDALSSTLQHTQHYMGIASEQAAYMRELGVEQASMYVERAARRGVADPAASWPRSTRWTARTERRTPRRRAASGADMQLDYAITAE